MVPKALDSNLRFRETVLELSYRHVDYSRELTAVCSRDILFYINTFGWTINPKEHARQPLRPFITYGYQDASLLELGEAIGQRDVALPKTRDMGASWMCLLALEHRWHFTPLQLFLLTSEKEELVDGPSEKALFRKLDFWWSHLPDWLLPNMKRQKKHCTNLDNGSAFDGEATVENMATGDRRTAIMMDETSKMPAAQKIFTSTRDVSKCRLFNSTPNGRFGVGQPFYEKVKNKATKKLFMHWSEHPEKSKGLYKLVDGVRIDLDPETYRWRDDYDFETLQFIGDNRPRSIWYDEQVDRSTSKKEVAQELDIDFLGSSERFADDEVMMRARKDDCQPATIKGRLIVDREDMETRWQASEGGDFSLWCELDCEGRPPAGEYCVGADVAAGTGGNYSSESALTIWNRRLGVQVGSFASNRIAPTDFATFTVAVCKWFRNAYLVPEANGPLGTTFLNRVKELCYFEVYVREQKDVFGAVMGKKIGYVNNDGGAEILSALQFAISDGRATVRDERIIEQMLEYEWSGGSLVHAGSKSSDSQADKGRTHGDIAIAAACGWWGVHKRPVQVEQAPEEQPKQGTFGHRMNAYEMKQRDKDTSDFDW
jgi:hypothetical protein